MQQLVRELWGGVFLFPLHRLLQAASKYPLIKPPSLKQTALSLPQSAAGCPFPPTGCRRLRPGSSPPPPERRGIILPLPRVILPGSF